MASPPNGGSGTHRPLNRSALIVDGLNQCAMGHFLRMDTVARQASSLPSPLQDVELGRCLADLTMKAWSLAEAAHL